MDRAERGLSSWRNVHDERTVMTTVTETLGHTARRASARARRSHLSAVAVVAVGLLAGFVAAPYLLG
jgi:hypothetical protein